MKSNSESCFAAVVASLAFGLLQIHAALGETPTTGASACTLNAPVTARPSTDLGIAWKTNGEPTSATAALDGKTIASDLQPGSGGMNVTAPQRYGTHVLTLTVSNGQGSSTCAAEIFVAAQTSATVPGNTFTWVYSPSDNGFTDDEIRHLAENYSYIVLTWQHGRGRIDRRHIDAQKIKAVNPHVKLFLYYSMTARLKRDSVGDRQHPPTFDRAWLLHDPVRGEEIPFTQRRSLVIGHFIDIANPAYQAWLRDKIQNWFKQAPYDGIAFDNSVPIADARHRRRELVGIDFSAEDVARYNNAIREILSQAKQSGLGKNDRKEVVFNGIARTASRRDRSLDLLRYGDVALNEQFCIASRGGAFLARDELKEDVDLMAAGAKVQQLVKYPAGRQGTPSDQAARFCYGVFMMGYQPGADFFNFRNDNRREPRETRYLNRIYGNAAEIRVDLGDPTARYADGDIWTRRFRRGVVYVNPEETPRTAILSRDAVLMNGNKTGAAFKSGATIVVPSRDALFFAYTDSGPSGSAISRQ